MIRHPRNSEELAHAVSAFVDAGEVVVRVGVVGIERERGLVRGDGVVDAAEVFERHAEVEGGGLVLRIGFACRAIVPLGRGSGALFVHETPEGHVRVGVVRID